MNATEFKYIDLNEKQKSELLHAEFTSILLSAELCLIAHKDNRDPDTALVSCLNIAAKRMVSRKARAVVHDAVLSANPMAWLKRRAKEFHNGIGMTYEQYLSYGSKINIEEVIKGEI